MSLHKAKVEHQLELFVFISWRGHGVLQLLFSPLTHLSDLRSTTAAPRRRSVVKDRKKLAEENKRLLQEPEKTKGLLGVSAPHLCTVLTFVRSC